MKKIGYLLLIMMLLVGCGPKKSDEVKILEKKILNLGEITLESLEKIEELENLYSALSEEDKVTLETYNKVINARETYDRLVLDSKLEELKYGAIKWNSDVPLSEVKEIKWSSHWKLQPEMFITKSNELYEFVTDKMYSNGYMTKKVDTNLKFDSFYIKPDDRDNSLIISNDGTYYEHEYDSLIEKSERHWKNETIKQIRSKYTSSYAVWQGGKIDYDKYYCIKDNQIYEIIYTDSYKASSIYQKKVSEEVIDTIPEGESFISLDGKIIKTNKAFYEIGVKNQKEVDQYVDVEPIIGLVKLEISELYEYIEYYNGTYLILKGDYEYLY